MSSKLASDLNLSIRQEKGVCKAFQLGNGRFAKMEGKVKASCAFAKDPTHGKIKCSFYVLKDLAVPLIMGSEFLAGTKTLRSFTQRLEDRISCGETLPMVNFIGSSQQPKYLLRALSNEQVTYVFADTGSDVDLMSPAYAKSHGYQIDRRAECRKRVQFADSTIAETIGQVRADLSLTGDKGTNSSKVFDILPGLPFEVLLGQQTLEEIEAFTTHASSFSELDGGGKRHLELCLISFIGMKSCTFLNFFSRRYRLTAGAHPSPTTSTAMERNDLQFYSLLARDAAGTEILQPQSHTEGVGSAAAIAQVVDAAPQNDGQDRLIATA